jgi:hypothetical protein
MNLMTASTDALGGRLYVGIVTSAAAHLGSAPA